MLKVPAYERVLRRVNVNGDCWEFPHSLDVQGYSHVTIIGRLSRKMNGLAHRVVYEGLVGTIPEGLALDHLCRVRMCVNPDHLEPVSWTENARRHWAYRRSGCLRGHALTGANVRLRPNGKRECVACSRRRMAEFRERRVGRNSVVGSRPSPAPATVRPL
jgi:hypothetical protein